MYRSSSMVMSALMAVCGVVMLVSALARGGGPLSVGVVMGTLFVAAGAGRIYVSRGRR